MFKHRQLIERVGIDRLKTVSNFKPHRFHSYKDGKIKLVGSDRLYCPKDWQAYLPEIQTNQIKAKWKFQNDQVTFTTCQ
jgi:hypothetical protein